jgi:metallo-beta-lactamase family protein
MRLTFLGGTGTVSGSRYLIRGGGRTLLVDCGLFQGLKELRLRNWAPLPVEPAAIDAVLLTHAHIDHSGWLPRLVRAGFAGPVYATAGTRALASILLPDAGRLQEEDAAHANRHGFSRHIPALPLYTEDDARAALERFHTVPFGDRLDVGGLKIRFTPAGHILGAASVHLADADTSVLLSGDLGRSSDPILLPPEPPAAAENVIVESTYGDRLHDAADPEDQLAEVINRTTRRGGTVLVPAFAVGRAQRLLYHLARLRAAERIAPVPVYLNSPMAIDTLKVLCDFRAEHRLSVAECMELCGVAQQIRDVEQSRWLGSRRGPMIIIAGSGMATGGRVLHHLAQLAPDHRNTVLLVGYQAAGTRGASLVAGGKQLKIHGRSIEVRAEVAQIASLSAHADRDELVAWLGRLPHQPLRTFVTHGEPASAAGLRAAIADRLGWPSETPSYLDEVELAHQPISHVAA